MIDCSHMAALSSLPLNVCGVTKIRSGVAVGVGAVTESPIGGPSSDGERGGVVIGGGRTTGEGVRDGWYEGTEGSCGGV